MLDYRYDETRPHWQEGRADTLYKRLQKLLRTEFTNSTEIEVVDNQPALCA